MMKKYNSKVLQYLAYRELNNNFLTLLGWSNTYKNGVYRIVPYIHLFLGISITLVIFGFVSVHSNNIIILIKSFSIMTSSTLVALKILCLIIYRQEVFELYDILDRHIMDLLKKDHLSHFIFHEVSRYRYLSLGGLLSVFIVNFIFNVMPIVKIISNHIHQVQPNYHIFPYPSWFPWPIPYSGIVYRLHFFYETLTSVTVIIVSPGVDSIFVYFVFLMISQLREISYAITHIDERNDNSIIVRKCINQYCSLLKCRDNLEKIYGPIILCLMTTNALVLCSSIYQIFQMESISIFKIILFFAYIIVKLIQTYMYSWCGTHLTMESEECRNAIYASNWYGNKRFMNSIMIMLQQRPLVITACNMSIVSIDIFSKILNTTVSYYFLLKTLE